MLLMAFDLRDFDRRMGLLKNTMRKAVQDELPHLSFLRYATDEEARERHEEKTKPLRELYGESPIASLD